MRSVIQGRYLMGVPIAGVSAGALIAPETCILDAEETGEAGMRIEPGLDLLRGVIVGVHYSELDALPAVLAAMQETGVETGLGIDDQACAVFEDGAFTGVLGRSVYWIEKSLMELRVSEIP